MQTYWPEFRRCRAYAGSMADQAPGGLKVRAIRCPGCPRQYGLGRAFNLVRPLPPVGGLLRLHGRKYQTRRGGCQPAAKEQCIQLLALGTAVAKRAWLSHETLQDIRRRRNAAGEVVIVIDPKGMPISL